MPDSLLSLGSNGKEQRRTLAAASELLLQTLEPKVRKKVYEPVAPNNDVQRFMHKYIPQSVPQTGLLQKALSQQLEQNAKIQELQTKTLSLEKNLASRTF